MRTIRRSMLFSLTGSLVIVVRNVEVDDVVPIDPLNRYNEGISRVEGESG